LKRPKQVLEMEQRAQSRKEMREKLAQAYAAKQEQRD
jgi:hypothetical protein